MIAPTCPRCAVPMKPGQAIKETVRGADVTYFVGGPGKLVTCWKCPKCGASEGKSE